MTTPTFPSLLALGPVLIVGLGETGVAAARWCLRHGVPLRIADTRTQPPGLAALGQTGSCTVQWRMGADALHPDALAGMRSLVISPGLSPLAPEVARLLAGARAAGIAVLGEMELFALALRDLAAQGYRPRVLGVTGTNGKTTVTAMARDLLRAAGWTVRAAGNISPAALAALAEALDADALPQAWVLELSSFQLETTHSLALDAAAILNLSQDHLDWHGSYAAYVAAKARVLAQTRVAVVNRDDAGVMALPGLAGVAQCVSFGSDAPSRAGDLGLQSHGDQVWLCIAGAAQDCAAVLPADALRVRGRHNALNALAALALVRALEPALGPALHALRDYAGEPHRMAFVRSVAGVDFINDSKGTNVGATVAALAGGDGPLVLIAGGLAKGQDFAPLADAVARRRCPVVLLGCDASVLQAALAPTGVPLVRVDSLDAAVQQAFALARPGTSVLLSPACASMDMFANYGARGRCFAAAVRDLALEQGEVA